MGYCECDDLEAVTTTVDNRVEYGVLSMVWFALSVVSSSVLPLSWTYYASSSHYDTTHT